MSTTTEVRSVTVGGRLLRVAVRPGRPNGVGDPPRCPLLLINGIGASLEVLEPVPGRPSVLAHMVTPRRYLNRGYLQRVAGDLYGGSARADPVSVAATMHDGIRVGPSRGYLYQLAAAAGWTSVPFLPWLRQPTLILAGDDDPLIPLINARMLHRLIRDSRLHVYHGGHLALVTEASELAPVVDGFLSPP
jgi:pimeloyl-ACP methyl ester carboxylesterase